MRVRTALSHLGVSSILAATLLTTPAVGAPNAAPPRAALRGLGPLTTTATSAYQGWNWANPDPVYEYRTAAGRLGIVRYDSSRHVLRVDRYDATSLRRIGRTTVVSLAGWPDWGGFYAAPDGYLYVLIGRENPHQSDQRDVVAVRRYNASWHRVGVAYVRGGANQGLKGIYSPFAAGDPHMILVGHRLVVHMSRLIYAIDGVHHQVSLTFEVEVPTMRARTFQSLGGYAYSSHSFQQLVALNHGDLVTVDHGDAYPRAVQLGVMAGYPTHRDVTTENVLEFNGAVGDNFTGASVTDLVSGPAGVVVLGDSIRQPNAPHGRLGDDTEHRNVFAISADPSTGAHRLRWLTRFPSHGADQAMEPRAVAVGANRYAVLFGVQHGRSRYRLEYRLIGSAGNVVASRTFPGVFHASIAEPILLGHRIYWAGTDVGASLPATAWLYGLDVTDPDSPTLIRRRS